MKKYINGDAFSLTALCNAATLIIKLCINGSPVPQAEMLFIEKLPPGELLWSMLPALSLSGDQQ